MWRKALIIIVAALLSGCLAEIDSVATSVDPSGWYSGQPKSLAFANEDTTALNTIQTRISIMSLDTRELSTVHMTSLITLWKIFS